MYLGVCLYLAIFWVPHVSEWDVKALFNRSTVYIAPLPKGAPYQCRLGCEHDTLRLLLLRPQPIRPTCTPGLVVTILEESNGIINYVALLMALETSLEICYK